MMDKEVKRAIKNAAKVLVKTDFGWCRVTKKDALDHIETADIFPPTFLDYAEESGTVRLGFDMRARSRDGNRYGPTPQSSGGGSINPPSMNSANPREK